MIEVGPDAASAAIASAVMSAPPVAVSAMALGGIQLQDWVYLATLGWIGLQAGYFVWVNIIRPRIQASRGK